MKKLALALAGGAVFAVAAPASAATIVLESDEGSDTLTGEFAGTVRNSGPFTREFTFVLPEAGRTAASITTAAVSMAGNIDFTSVTLNGQNFNLTPNGQFEFGSIALNTDSGLQTLIVNGIAQTTPGNNAAFSGVVTFAAGAIPEPGMWALMILGFGFVGGALRSRRNSSVKTNFDFA
ncbi:PEP-CTERM sorting domain-containing protein [Erythrobacter litoralis]|uniref:FxDxF family PEP-CTERM protein n=1 Tax=Erythrobacter litoralis TaxID=39960 RepID=UPI002434E3A3|nr:FxDxF family PEP-CTERM protein [Erythrobacter litoralis]MDG6079078.1 PEP-CTERM sorting domain-containing protein [Erythrobacter litoralis]